MFGRRKWQNIGLRNVRFAVCTAGVLLIAGQQAPQPRPQMSRISADLNYLTSRELAGRLSLTPEADKAAQYLAGEFKKAGVQPANDGSYLQSFPLVAYEPRPKEQRLQLTRSGTVRKFVPVEDFAGHFNRNVHIKGDVVFAGYGITAREYGYDDYANVAVKGKIVLIFDHEPQENDAISVFNGTGHTLHAGRWLKVENARKHGATAILIASDPRDREAGKTLKQPVRPPQRATAPPQDLDDPGAIPMFSIGQTVLAALLEPTHHTPEELQQLIDAGLKPQSTALADTKVDLRITGQKHRRGLSLNVAGLWEGRDPALKAETVMLTAHYDHLGVQRGNLYPGANDNTSGTVAVLELARMFAQSGYRPTRSILFVIFGSEEEMMLGSFYYTAHPLRPLATTRAVLNLDMIGRNEEHIAQDEGGLPIPADTTNEINLVGSFYSPDLRAAIRKEDESTGLQLDTKYDADHTLNALFRCDHLPFLIEGIPSVWLFGGFHPGYHEPVDTVDRLNLTKIEKVVSLTYRTAADVADAAIPPRFNAAGSR